MKDLLLPLIVTITMHPAFAQNKISNIRTEKHRQIKGTKFFIVPPDNFSQATSFPGLQETNSSSSILFVEIPGPVTQIKQGFTPEGLKTQGMTLIKRESLQLNDSEAELFTTEQNAYGRTFSKYILVLGDENKTNIINGTFPKGSDELGQQILASMLSVVSEPDLKVDPLDAVPFTVSVENTKLTFARTMSGMVLYTVDGKVPTESADKAMFIAGRSLGGGPVTNQKATSLTRLGQLPYSDLKFGEGKEIIIDEMQGYEVLAEGTSKTDGEKEFIYQVMLFPETGYYLMIGTAKADFEENLAIFRGIAGTFKRK